MPKLDQQTQFEAGGLEVILDLGAVLCESPPNREIREIRGKTEHFRVFRAVPGFPPSDAAGSRRGFACLGWSGYSRS